MRAGALSVGALSLGLCAIATLGALLFGWLSARRRQQIELTRQQQADAIQAEIAHTAKVNGTEKASQVVRLAYAQQIEQLDAAQKADMAMLKGDPLAMAKYIQAVIDRVGPL